jgi:hypothetical protein
MVFLSVLQIVKNWKIIFSVIAVVYLLWFFTMGGIIVLQVLAGQ